MKFLKGFVEDYGNVKIVIISILINLEKVNFVFAKKVDRKRLLGVSQKQTLFRFMNMLKCSIENKEKLLQLIKRGRLMEQVKKYGYTKIYVNRVVNLLQKFFWKIYRN